MMIRIKKVALLVTGVICTLAARAQTTVQFNDPNIHYMGRVGMEESTAVLSWSGTSVSINFKGTGINYTLKDERGDNYYNEILDGQVVAIVHEKTDKPFTKSIIGLSNASHTLQLFKRSEWTAGKTWFYNFKLSDGTVLPATPTKKRKIEFFGNSITCGYAIEDTTGQDRGSPPFENNYLSYAALTARHFDAEYYCTARSGIGILVSWFPQVMPEMYNLLYGDDPKSLWDFSKYTPDVVVVNLFQNDSWIVKMPDNPQFKARFGTKAPGEGQIIAAYTDFIKTLRKTYPKAQIICALGSMDATATGSAWPGYIEKAVATLGDKKIYTHFFPYKNTPGHPNVKEQQVMADDLIDFIEGHIHW